MLATPVIPESCAKIAPRASDTEKWWRPAPLPGEDGLPERLHGIALGLELASARATCSSSFSAAAWVRARIAR